MFKWFKRIAPAVTDNALAHPDNPPFKVGDKVVVKEDIWYKYNQIFTTNYKEVLTFRKGEILEVRWVDFRSRKCGWSISFIGKNISEHNERDSWFNSKLFSLVTE